MRIMSGARLMLGRLSMGGNSLQNEGVVSEWLRQADKRMGDSLRYPFKNPLTIDPE